MLLFGLAGSLQSLARQSGQALLPRNLLYRQIQKLEHDNAELRFQLRQLETEKLENARLRNALEWQQRTPWQLKIGRVIAHDPANWWRSLLIDLGQRDGLVVNQTVLTPDGLVGRISEVSLAHSRVLLVGDPNCRFSAQVEDSRDKGIITPDETSFDHHVVLFSFVPVNTPLRPGAAVLTSGDGGIFPKGIPVGRIADVRTNDFGLYLEARVRLAANLNRLEEVWVIQK
jgi:rod shape-determining protein MreC